MNFPWKKKREPKPLTTKEMSQAEVMGYLWFPEKQQEVTKVDNTQKVEEIMEAIIEYEYAGTSPLDGSPIATVRSSDIYNVLCTYFDVDPKETEWSDYA